jgi:pyruvate dehydrogenase E1 component alpha subunit
MDASLLLGLYGQMCLCRRFEEAAAKAYSQGKVSGFLHLYIGQEAVAVGAISAAAPTDYIVATYREHAHYLARTGDARGAMAELYGKASGCSGGRGGSMHLFDAERRFLGGWAIVGGHVPIAAGVAFASRYRAEKDVTLCFFGDGTANMGAFHEGLALAGLWKLPVVFICENNQYAMGTPLYRTLSVEDVAVRARGYPMESEIVNGDDVLEVREAVRQAVGRARRDHVPCFIEAKTYRFRGHSVADPAKYRTKEEVQKWMERDPLRVLAERILGLGIATRSSSGGSTRRRRPRSRRPSSSPSARPCPRPRRWPSTSMPELRTLSFREALREAMVEEMERDDSIFLMGEEVGHYQGAYKVSEGMLARFGERRVIDTPISETGFAGVGIGAAMVGLRPIIEFMTWNFSLVAVDQLVNNAAKLCYMSNGQFTLPVVFRGPGGAAHALGAQHSQALESFYAHVPGLKVVVPSTPADGKGLLKAAIRDDNPVVFIESEVMYALKGEVPTGEHVVPLGVADLKRPGRDVTVVTWGKMLHTAMKAAEALAGEGIEAEVLDLRTIRPLDEAAVLRSVKHTSRCVVVQEGWPFAGVAAEVIALVAREAFDHLDAPPERVTNLDVPMPYARNLEQLVLPSVERVVDAVHRTLGRPEQPASVAAAARSR